MSKYLSDCCYSNFIKPDYPDTDICGMCYEHASIAEEE